MAYRNGTYIAFHANNTSNPTESDMKYYNILRSWKVRDEGDFKFVNSHDKRDVRDGSSKQTLRRGLLERMNNSKNMLLIIGKTTRLDTDWIPFEISHAIDNCEMPIIAAYPSYDSIMAPNQLRDLWPKALAERIDSGDAKVIHVPFRKEAIADALDQFDLTNLPATGLNYYSKKTYEGWGYFDK